VAAGVTGVVLGPCCLSGPGVGAWGRNPLTFMAPDTQYALAGPLHAAAELKQVRVGKRVLAGWVGGGGGGFYLGLLSGRQTSSRPFKIGSGADADIPIPTHLKAIPISMPGMRPGMPHPILPHLKAIPISMPGRMLTPPHQISTRYLSQCLDASPHPTASQGDTNSAHHKAWARSLWVGAGGQGDARRGPGGPHERGVLHHGRGQRRGAGGPAGHARPGRGRLLQVRVACGAWCAARDALCVVAHGAPSMPAGGL